MSNDELKDFTRGSGRRRRETLRRKREREQDTEEAARDFLIDLLAETTDNLCKLVDSFKEAKTVFANPNCLAYQVTDDS